MMSLHHSKRSLVLTILRRASLLNAMVTQRSYCVLQVKARHLCLDLEGGGDLGPTARAVPPYLEGARPLLVLLGTPSAFDKPKGAPAVVVRAAPPSVGLEQWVRSQFNQPAVSLACYPQAQLDLRAHIRSTCRLWHTYLRRYTTHVCTESPSYGRWLYCLGCLCAVAATHHLSIHHNDHDHECAVSQLADVEFVLADGSIIYAHRLVLAHVSEYFQQLFLGGYLPSSPAAAAPPFLAAAAAASAAPVPLPLVAVVLVTSASMHYLL